MGTSNLKANDMTSDISTLKDILEELTPIISAADRIKSGFDESEEMALALLLFFRERGTLDQLVKMRDTLSANLEEKVSESEYAAWLQRDMKLWNPPQKKTTEELLSMLEKLHNPWISVADYRASKV